MPLAPRAIVLGLLLSGTLSLPAAPPTQTTIVVDLAHSQVGQADGKEGLNYTLPPSRALTVDARKFDFKQSLYPNIRPNAIQLIIGKDQQYSATWHSSGQTTLSASTLTPMNETPLFSGLKAGDRAIVAIGAQRLDSVKQEIILKVLWVDLVDVK